MNVTVASALPGRTRFRIAEVKRDASLAREIEDRLRALPGVRHAEANPVTGSVLVHYEEALAFDAFRDVFPELTEGRPGEPAESVDPNQAVVVGIASLLRNANAQVARATGGVDLRVIIPLALFLYGLRDLLFSERVARPPWYNLFWYSTRLFHLLNRSVLGAFR